MISVSFGSTTFYNLVKHELLHAILAMLSSALQLQCFLASQSINSCSKSMIKHTLGTIERALHVFLRRFLSVSSMSLIRYITNSMDISTPRILYLKAADLVSMISSQRD